MSSALAHVKFLATAVQMRLIIRGPLRECNRAGLLSIMLKHGGSVHVVDEYGHQHSCQAPSV